MSRSAPYIKKNKHPMFNGQDSSNNNNNYNSNFAGSQLNPSSIFASFNQSVPNEMDNNNNNNHSINDNNYYISVDNDTTSDANNNNNNNNHSLSDGFISNISAGLHRYILLSVLE